MKDLLIRLTAPNMNCIFLPFTWDYIISNTGLEPLDVSLNEVFLSLIFLIIDNEKAYMIFFVCVNTLN